MTRIMVTNDDGVHAPGIFALASALREICDVEVFAPAHNQSASGHKKTLFGDIRVEETTLRDGNPAMAIDGSPADCIALAALGLSENWPPRLVVSGVNRGANMGQDVTYSGTVSAALEATIQGVPAIAVSMDDLTANDPEEYETAARIAADIVKVVITKSLPQFTILNVNVPKGKNIRGLRLTRQGIRIYRDELERDGDIVRIAGDIPAGVLDEEGTDLWAVHEGYASVTPIHLDFTAHHFVADVAAWDIGLSVLSSEKSPKIAQKTTLTNGIAQHESTNGEKSQQQPEKQHRRGDEFK